jgi:site-specific DNA-methyltransferase (adenine-specific)
MTKDDFYWKSENGVIYCEDHIKVLKDFPEKCIDLVITSPPYDELRDYHGYKFNFADLAQQLSRIMKIGGIVIWVVGDSTKDGSETLTSFKQAIYFKERAGFRVHDTMIYHKKGFSNPGNVRYHQIFEYMFVFSKGKPKTFTPIQDRKTKFRKPFGKNTTRQKDGSMKEVREEPLRKAVGMRTNVWNMKTAGQEMVCRKLPHPAMFPRTLARDHILSWSRPNDVVLDPMCGAGTTLVEAEKLQRKWIGIDVSEQYCEISKKRMQSVLRRGTQMSIKL